MDVWQSFLFLFLLAQAQANQNPPFSGEPIEDEEISVETKGVEVELEGVEPIAALRFPTPRPLIPTFYSIRIQPIFDPADDEHLRFSVPGSVTILVDCVSDTRTIKLHAKSIDVKVQATKVTLKGEEPQKVGIESQDATQEGIFVVRTLEPLVFGATYEIYIEYTARVFRDRLNGMYLSNYTNPTTNETEFLVVTQFEPQGARQLFPGFDDPDLKAKFEVTVGRREGYNTLSNMYLQDSSPMAGHDAWHWDRFQTTPRMSTYLLAIIVSKFKSHEADLALFGGKSVKVWGAAHYIQKGGGAYGAQTAATILSHYEKYFGVEYPLPKMDSAAIPHFDAGAMENYGLNTYREKYLLYFPGVSTEDERSRVCSVIAHELGHQWFGDLVTCKSWSQLWLNEGFAAYVQNIGAEAACPEFEPWSTFVSQTMQVAMQYDQSTQTHPIVNDSDTTARFSKITYNKGASVLRMLRDLLGDEVFLKGLGNYLHKLSFGNAHQDDLFAAFEEEGRREGSNPTEISLADTMQGWTLRKGFPLVRVTRLNATTIGFSQEEFEKPKYLRDSRSDEDLWWIPLRMKGAGQKETTKFWMPSYIVSLEKKGLAEDDWLIVNWDAIGYYRVIYDDALLARIKRQLDDDPSQISANSRSQLLDDYFNFAFLNYVNVKSALELTTYLDKEDSYNVWTTVYTNLKRTIALLSTTPAQESLQAYLQPKLNAALHKIGFAQAPSDKGIQVPFRAFLLAWACKFKDSECEEYAQKLFEGWMKEPETNRIPVDIQSTVYCTAVRLDSDSRVWNFVTAQLPASTPRQRALLLTSLACSRNSSKTERILHEALESETLPAADVDSFVSKLATFPSGRQSLLKLLEERPKRLVDFYKSDKKMGGIVKMLSSYTHGQRESNQIQRMLGTIVRDEDTVRMIRELIDDNGTWMSKFYQPIKSWTEDQVSPHPRPFSH